MLVITIYYEAADETKHFTCSSWQVAEAAVEMTLTKLGRKWTTRMGDGVMVYDDLTHFSSDPDDHGTPHAMIGNVTEITQPTDLSEID